MTAGRGERGAGVFATAAGTLAFLMLMIFAVQLLVGLHATTVITAVTNDAARRAAAAEAPPQSVIEADARASLGAVGRAATFIWDESEPSSVALTVVATPPRFVPPSVGGMVGIDHVERTVRVRLEQPVP